MKRHIRILHTLLARAIALGLGVSLSPCALADASLAAGLNRILGEHYLMRAVTSDVSAAREQVGIERSAWFPRLGVRVNGGRQDIDRDVGTEGSFSPRDAVLTANQLVWDFGATNAAIARAESNLGKEELERATQRINLVLAGIDAHLKLLRAQVTLDYARQSEGHVKHQTQLENARIEAGKGYSTDLLQAKVQLAGAQARRVGAEGVLATAVNRYKAVFGDGQVPAGRLEFILEPAAALPKTIEEALTLVAGANPDVLAARARAELKMAEREATRTKEWMPRIDLQAESGHKKEYDGVAGNRHDTKLLLQASWNFDVGLRARHATDAAGHAAASEVEKSHYVVQQATEEARNAWSDLTSARERLAFLNDQVSIATRFLELARKERELGRRSLLDVLQGETSLINAQSDAAAAEMDVVLAAFRVLRATGKLDPALVVARK